MGAHWPSTFQLRRRTPGTFVLVPSPRQGRSIRCQGQLEAAAAQILIACPLVSTIEEQPQQIWYVWDEPSHFIQLLDDVPVAAIRKSQRTSYIVPDFLVTMHGGRKRLLEIKPSSKLIRPDVQRKLLVGRRFAEREGWSYHVVTERELFVSPLLNNVRLLNRFRRVKIDETFLRELELFVLRSPTPLAVLIKAFVTFEPSIVRTAALHLVAGGRLDLDLAAAPISETTWLHPRGALPWDPFDSAWGPSGCLTNGPIASSDSSAPKNSLPKI